MSSARVAALTRYPVKSLAGETLTAATIGPRGLDGDRSWAVRTEDGGIGSGKTTRRFRRVDGLLGLAATTDGVAPVITVPETDVPHHDEAPVHVITTAALRRVAELLGRPVDVARLRADVVLDVPGSGFPEEEWDGRPIAVGDEVVLRPDGGMVRCRMVDLLDGGPADDGILRLLGRERDAVFGLRALVERGGTVRVGDPAGLV